MKKIVCMLLAACLLCAAAGCSKNLPDESDASGKADAYADAVQVQLTDEGVAVNGKAAGEKPAAVYVSHDIVYHEDRDAYDSGNPYGEGEAWQRHTAAEAAAHTVVNITQPGTYRISGTLSAGQLRVDLGEEAFADPAAVVTLVLDGADITCTVAPAILFLNVYECDRARSAETAESTVDTAAAGANLVLADGSVNAVHGSHVARIYKDAAGEKKLWKQDGAIYSYMSMNADGGSEGTGTLELFADNEGMDTERHLTVNGGNWHIRSDNDGINTNEDGVSVTTINGGTVHIIAGLGEEGDGIDSNGWLVINGGTVIASANPAADAGLDSDMGSYINGGTVVALGSAMDWAESDSAQVTMNLQFAAYRDAGDVITVTQEGAVVFACDPSENEVLAKTGRQYRGAILSSPAFSVGVEYQIFIGGTVTGSECGGIYDPVTVTDFTGGVQQGFTGTDVTLRPDAGAFGGGDKDGFGERPEGFGPPQDDFDGWFLKDPDSRNTPQTPPEGFDGKGAFGGAQSPEGFGKHPAGFGDGNMPMPPQGGFGGRDDPAGDAAADAPLRTIFRMRDQVNAFSGVQDIK